MKIKYMKMIINKADDIIQAKKMLYKLDKKSDKCIERFIDLIHTLKECEYNGLEYKIATNADVLEFRTVEEQIQLMIKLKECNYNENAAEIVTNRNVLEFRTVEEQIQLMNILKENLYNDSVLIIATSSSILSQRLMCEQIQLIETLKKCCYNHNVCIRALAHSSSVPLEQVIQDMIKSCELYHQLDNEEIELKTNVTHDCNRRNIQNLNELKDYILELETHYSADTDINAETIVPVYKYGTKEHK